MLPLCQYWRINANTRILSATTAMKLVILNERVYLVSVHIVIRNMCPSNVQMQILCLLTPPNSDLSDDTDVLYHIFSVTGAAPLKTQVTVNGVAVLFQIDTGARVSLINVNDYNDKFHDCELTESNVKLHAYTGNTISVVGQCNVTAELAGQSVHLPLVVVEGNGPPLLGQSWLQKQRIPCDKMFEVNLVHNDHALQSVLLDSIQCFPMLPDYFRMLHCILIMTNP